MDQPSTAEHQQPHDQLIDAVREAANTVAGGGTLTPAQLQTMAEAMADREVGRLCMGFAAGGDDAVEPAAAAALWQQLTRDLADEHRAGPALLLAYAAALEGDTTTMEHALQVAASSGAGDEPEDDLVAVLRDLHDRGRIRRASLAAVCHDWALIARFYLDQR